MNTLGDVECSRQAAQDLLRASLQEGGKAFTVPGKGCFRLAARLAVFFGRGRWPGLGGESGLELPDVRGVLQEERTQAPFLAAVCGEHGQEITIDRQARGGRTSRSRTDSGVESFDLFEVLGDPESLGRSAHCDRHPRSLASWQAQEPERLFGEIARVARREREARQSVFDQFGNPSDPTGDHG